MPRTSLCRSGQMLPMVRHGLAAVTLFACCSFSSAVTLRFQRTQPISGNTSLRLSAEAVSLLEQSPGGAACAPTCTWECQTPTCEQVCEPKCQAPRCETRCNATDTKGCGTQCDVPQCMITCPQPRCAKKDCGQCKVSCSEPLCLLKCPTPQPCRNVCEEPVCDWQCKQPTSCPKPLCHMKCEAPKDCPGTTVHEKLPPVAAGETVLQAFKPPPQAPSPAFNPCAPAAAPPGVSPVIPCVHAAPGPAAPAGVEPWKPAS